MNQAEIAQAQNIINGLSVGDKKSLKEFYGESWNQFSNPTDFGKKFKEAVESKNLNNIKHIGIRTTGRCDEYERI